MCRSYPWELFSNASVISGISPHAILLGFRGGLVQNSVRLTRYYPRPYDSRRFSAGQAAAMRHLGARRELSRNVFGLDDEILQHLFNLRHWEKESLLGHYEEKYGRSAASYARRIWENWKSGTCGVSGQVAERFIYLAPKVLLQDARLEVVGKMYKRTKQLETHYLTAILGYKEGALTEIEKLFERLCQKPFEHKWPDSLVRFASWLCDDDSEAAKRIIAAIETENSMVIVKVARLECNRLREALHNLDSAYAGTHLIELPFGRITLRIRKPNLFEKIKKLLS